MQRKKSRSGKCKPPMTNFSSVNIVLHICDAKFENDVVSNSSNGEDLNDEDICVTSPLSYQKFLFVHQTTWQRRLLSKYGNDICLLDATYKTTRYALPLFFLAVKTNVDYQVVASLFCSPR